MTLDRTIAPEVHEIGNLTIPPLTEIDLAGGAKLHIVDGGDSEVTRLTVSVAGGLVEMPSAELSALIAPAWIEGTERHSGQELADFFDYHGAWLQTATGIHRMSLTVNALNSNVDDVITMAGEIVTSAVFPKDNLRQIALRTANRLEVERSKTSWNASSALRTRIYGENHPLQREASPALLHSVDRQMLEDYYRSILTAENVEFFLCGKVKDSTVKVVERLAQALPSTGQRLVLADMPFDPSSDHTPIHIVKADSMQSAVRIGLVLPGRNSDDFIALRFLVMALGGYFGSRLMTAIREEKGYTYGINAVLLGYTTDSYMNISSETDCGHVAPLISDTIAEIERMKDPASYTAEEVERLKSFVLSNLAVTLDTPMSVMDHYQSVITVGAPADYFYRQQQCIREITAEKLAFLASKYFDTSKLYISTSGKTLKLEFTNEK
ncbi:MAG: insulinase family protein [Lachnoclostridium sp.]|nr:insulinase family protein [Lachnoclostridium sp.]